MKNNKNHIYLIFIFLYTTFNGAFRKWVFVGNNGLNQVLHFIQLLLPIAVIFFLKKETKDTNINVITNLYIFVLLLLSVHPLNHTFFHGIFGIILHLSFFFLIFAYTADTQAFPLEKLLNLFLIVSISQVSLALIQFNLDSSSFWNRYERTQDVGVIAGVGSFVRATGTFSYLSGYGCYMFFYACLVWYIQLTKSKSVIFINILAGLGLIGSFASGSRSTTFLYVLFMMFVFLGGKHIQQKIKTVSVLFFLVLLSITYNITDKIPVIKNSFNAFSERVEENSNTGETQTRTLGPIERVFKFRGTYPIFGLGLGATYQGAVALWGQSRQLTKYGYYEDELERVILEGGFFLLFIRMFLFSIIWYKLKIPKYYSAVLLALIFCYTPIIFNVYQIIYVFFGLALVDKGYGSLKQAS